MNNIRSANGIKACLIFIHGINKYVVRVYREDHKFTDYDLMHCDLGIVIDDEDAAFYEDQRLLDHSPETLGMI